MSPSIGIALALAALGVGYAGYGWQGLVLAVTIIVFVLLLQFNRVMRVMRTASRAPVGQVPSAVMLQAKLRQGMTLLDLVRTAGSLGRCEQETEAGARYVWSDPGGARLAAEFRKGRLTAWRLERPDQPEAQATEAP